MAKGSESAIIANITKYNSKVHSSILEKNKDFTSKMTQLNIDSFKQTDVLTKKNPVFSIEQPTLFNRRIAIINPFTNKFNDIYASYFLKHNQVKIIIPKTKEELDSVADWAEIIWSTWCNEPLVYLSQKKRSALLISHIRSYEILTPSLMQSINWDNIDGAIFVADHIRENANEMWNNQLSKIPQTTICNCVELDRYPFYQNGIGYNIVYIGYINHKKGIGLLLQCIDTAVRLNTKFIFHIAGSFQEVRFEVYMKHLIKEMGLDKNVIFHGWIKDVPKFLANMNYVISTSPWEGCPNNIIEAMACGVKPLIHNWQGAKKLFPAKLVFNNLSEYLSILHNDCSGTSGNHYDSDSYRRWVERYYNASIQVATIDNFIAKLWQNRL
ncbi:MAG: glycosyltransferase family 4 protein [Desulfamplus sp.]|nr:glycosyltransferase family 4 protein [Desulfamplus sp.]